MYEVIRFFKHLPHILYTLVAGLLEWFIPANWYAKDVSKDIVLITGGATGLGRAIALEYAKLGSSIILWDIDEKGMSESRELVRDEHEKLKDGRADRFCSIYRVDVSDKNDIKQQASQVFTDLNKNQRDGEEEKYVTVLVNNAGIYHNLWLQELRDDQIERMFNINVLAHFWTVRAFLPSMIKHQKGHIVEIASLGGLAPMVRAADYCASNHAVIAFEEVLSIELDHMGLKDKIHTTVICPAFFKSNLYISTNKSLIEKIERKFFMSSGHVARETVKAMRCNHSRLLLPRFLCYLMTIAKPWGPRGTILAVQRAIGFAGIAKHTKVPINIETGGGTSETEFLRMCNTAERWSSNSPYGKSTPIEVA